MYFEPVCVCGKKRRVNNVTVSDQVVFIGVIKQDMCRLSDNGRMCGWFVVDSPTGIS